MKYNKLVRDKIPQIIESSGLTAVTHVADDSEYLKKLKEKLVEEVHEVLEDTNIVEELADLLEVIHALLSFKNISFDELEEKRVKKREMKGGFQERIILEETK